MDNDNKIWESLYTMRLVILLETSPQSNTYHQIMLDPKQFKTVSDAIGSSFPKQQHHKCDNPQCTGNEILFSDREVKLPDNMIDIHYCEKNTDCKC